MEEFRNKSQNRRAATYGKQPTVEKLLNYAAEHGEPETGIIGVVAELGCVEDDNEAELLSKILSSKMQTVVLKDVEVINFHLVSTDFHRR